MSKNPKYKFAGIIPSRYGSARFPGKPLALIGEKPMIRRVYEQAVKALENVFVATDDIRIYDVVSGFGGKAVMTSPDHRTGTDRCAEALGIIMKEYDLPVDIVINIQGDEPFIKPQQIELLMNCFSSDSIEIATLIRKWDPGENLFNSNLTKVIRNREGNAIYFSRSVIPFIRDNDETKWAEKHVFFKHIGLYAYRSDVLKKITSLERSPLEIAESLEQNRWIENGYRIKTALSNWDNMGIDTPEDLKKANLNIQQYI